MKQRSNRIAERAGVNAARSFFEAAGCIFQEVSQDNDFGKDAYVDISDDSLSVSGICFAVQIKSGKSYTSKSGCCIPFSQKHAEVWKQSPLHIIGVVLDPCKNELYWGSITEHLQKNTPKSPSNIPINIKLDTESLRNILIPLVSNHLIYQPILDLACANSDRATAAVWGCFALGRRDARTFRLLRYSLLHLEPQPRQAAIIVLSHLVPHPDILWSKHNWIGHQIASELAPTLKWSPAELVSMFCAVSQLGRETGDDVWGRGTVGQCLAMLVLNEKEYNLKALRDAIPLAVGADDDAAFWMAYHTICLESGNHVTQWDYLIRNFPSIGEHELACEVVANLEDFGHLHLY